MKQDRGAAMIELALILPLLVMLLVGIVEFGQAYSAQVRITGAAREGARALALGEDTATVTSIVKKAAGSTTATIDPPIACPNPSSAGDVATVIVNDTFQFNIPFVAALIGASGKKTFSASASMRCGL